MSISDQEYTVIIEDTRKITNEWGIRFGDAGNVMAGEVDKIVDLVLLHLEQTHLTPEQVSEMIQSQVNELVQSQVDELIRSSVAPWALVGNEDPIPMEKIDKAGVLMLVANPAFITDGELLEIIKTRAELGSSI